MVRHEHPPAALVRVRLGELPHVAQHLAVEVASTHELPGRDRGVPSDNDPHIRRVVSRDLRTPGLPEPENVGLRHPLHAGHGHDQIACALRIEYGHVSAKMSSIPRALEAKDLLNLRRSRRLSACTPHEHPRDGYECRKHGFNCCLTCRFSGGAERRPLQPVVSHHSINRNQSRTVS